MTRKRPIEALQEVIGKLRKYAHNPDCEAFLQCPNWHQDCKAKLGLDTAIAWDLADELSKMLNYIATSKREGSYSFTFVRDEIFRIALNGNAFDRVLFKHGYLPLRYLISDMNKALARVLDILRREDQDGSTVKEKEVHNEG